MLKGVHDANLDSSIFYAKVPRIVGSKDLCVGSDPKLQSRSILQRGFL